MTINQKNRVEGKEFQAHLLNGEGRERQQPFLVLLVHKTPLFTLCSSVTLA